MPWRATADPAKGIGRILPEEPDLTNSCSGRKSRHMTSRRRPAVLALGAGALFWGTLALAGQLKIEIEGIGQGEAIPRKFTCAGENISPAIRWSGVPEGAKSLALVVDDPDAPAGTWVHWVVYDLPGALEGLGEGAGNKGSPGIQGVNDFGRPGYGGPCPPPGKPHRYFFRLFALDRQAGLAAGATKGDLMRAIEGHVLGSAETWATFGR